MGNKKRHITSLEELYGAMRCTGYTFPKNNIEQRISLKGQVEFDFESLAKEIDPEEIWNADRPKKYAKTLIKNDENTDSEIAKSWGMAARGSANISKDTLKKILENQKRNKPDK